MIPSILPPSSTPSSFKLDLSGLPLPDMEMDMGELFDGVELNISQDGLQTLMKKRS